jgi:hypothetical protein
MKTTVRELVEALQAQGQGGLKRLSTQPLGIKMAYKINRLADSAMSAYNEYEKVRYSLIVKYGAPVKDADGNDTADLQVLPENTEAFTKELEEFVDTEKDIWYEPVTLQELEGVKLSAGDITFLKPFIIFPEDDNGVIEIPERKLITVK